MSGKLMLRCVGWTPIGKNSLLGKCDIKIAELRLSIKGVLVLQSNGVRWASLPSPAMLDKNGVALRDDAGRIKYNAVFSFDNKQVRDAFSAAIIDAVLTAYPGALEMVTA